MRVEVEYRGKSREELDDRAIADARAYLSAKQWKALMEMVADPACTVQHINIGLGIAGVTGRPFTALMRKYRLKEFRAWVMSTSGGEPFPIDKAGFYGAEARIEPTDRAEFDLVQALRERGLSPGDADALDIAEGIAQEHGVTAELAILFK